VTLLTVRHSPFFPVVFASPVLSANFSFEPIPGQDFLTGAPSLLALAGRFQFGLLCSCAAPLCQLLTLLGATTWGLKQAWPARTPPTAAFSRRRARCPTHAKIRPATSLVATPFASPRAKSAAPSHPTAPGCGPPTRRTSSARPTTPPPCNSTSTSGRHPRSRANTATVADLPPPRP